MPTRAGHYDWFSWELDADWDPVPPQVFLMYYLHSTSSANGCLRAIPCSHCGHNELRDVLVELGLGRIVALYYYLSNLYRIC